MTYETWYDEDGKPEHVYVKEEPDCFTCSDRGQITVDADGKMTFWYATGPGVRQTNCPDCCPTDEQIAEQAAAYEAQEAEHAAAVARGEVSVADDPWGPF